MWRREEDEIAYKKGIASLTINYMDSDKNCNRSINSHCVITNNWKHNRSAPQKKLDG